MKFNVDSDTCVHSLSLLGYTRLFQPSKPITKAQAATALSTGEASDIYS